MLILEAGARKLGLSLGPQQLEQFRIYYQELADWNQRVNLTSITGYEEVQVKHFLDSLTVALALRERADYVSCRVIDIGAGAGFPGVPLKIALPEIRLTLLEATVKKTLFLQHIKDKLGLGGVEVVTGRAEEIAHQSDYRERFDVALSRAVGELPVLAEICLPFCVAGGLCIAQKKGDIEAELRSAGRAIDLMGGRLREMKKIELEGLADGRCLVIIEKVAATPPQYPRRPGMPNKKPLV